MTLLLRAALSLGLIAAGWLASAALWSTAAVPASSSARLPLATVPSGVELAALEQAERGHSSPSVPVLSVKEIRTRVLDDSAQLLEYRLGEPHSTLWLVSPDSVESYELASRDTLEGAARRTSELASQGYARVTRVNLDLALDELGTLLLGPVANRLRAPNLLIVPDGALVEVPFAALHLPGGSDARSPQPLMEAHAVVTLPSASTLAYLRQRAASRPRAGRMLAVVADPIYSGSDSRFTAEVPAAESSPEDLLRLPYSGAEARAILALVPPGESLSALGFAANRKTVMDGRLRDYRIIHLATHGVNDGRQPGLLLSALDAHGKRQDPLLRADEIDRLELRADLVVLSACQTAVAGPDPTAVSLSERFFHAGATQVLASWWPVDDSATAYLMSQFYRSLLTEGQSEAAALRAAQLATMRESPAWSSPFFWAGFRLSGDWR